MSNPNPSNGTTVASLPPEAIAFATRMYDAARNGDIEIFEQALPAGLPANMTNEKGDSLIMLAAYHGHAPLVRLLLQHGADPNSLNDRGQSPLAGAVFKGETEVVEALLEGNADPDHGSPSAKRAIELFKQEDKWAQKFADAPGKGKAV
ncbi:20a2f0fb-2a8f-48cd-889f-8d0aaf85cea1 [Sclerotinia trifoliorum]|uniref:20a2f0fb-2a8f-48cd-889f-8d0aaf85cea1 n=1 Tax=Sclerotinia trifoliorum TaxID=28548 RepID=A0A8H2W6J4_9HELO|nr:20a2f0fb-2a8f-48cd-889f-8d0aaf85cea1 [Sclerotinia trifoliorum]